jgi:hypothetical protein
VARFKEGRSAPHSNIQLHGKAAILRRGIATAKGQIRSAGSA